MPPRLGRPITLPPPLRTPLRKTHRTLGQIHMLTHKTHKQRVTGIGKLRLRSRSQHFYCHYGTHLHLLLPKAVGNAGTSMVETLSNVMAVKHKCYLLLHEIFYVRASVMVLIALSPKRHSVWLYLFHSYKSRMQQSLTNVSVLP